MCKQLGVDVGDRVEMVVEDGSLMVTPSKKRALDALAELRRLFAESGISEKELLAEGRLVRRELNKEQYPSLYHED